MHGLVGSVGVAESGIASYVAVRPRIAHTRASHCRDFVIRTGALFRAISLAVGNGRLERE